MLAVIFVSDIFHFGLFLCCLHIWILLQLLAVIFVSNFSFRTVCSGDGYPNSFCHMQLFKRGLK